MISGAPNRTLLKIEIPGMGEIVSGFDGTSFYDTSLVARLDVPAGCDGGEVLVAAFEEGPDAVASTLDYQGLATLTVSGVGQASGSDFSDAFYVFATGDGEPIESPWHSSVAYNWVLAINGQHVEALTPDGAIPAYRPDHRYTVSIRAPAGPSPPRRLTRKRSPRSTLPPTPAPTSRPTWTPSR